MSKGKAKLVNLGETGQVISENAPSWDFIYETSLVRNTNWYPGDRVVLPDGREYRYARSLTMPNGTSEILSTVEACSFTGAGGTVGWTSAVASVPVGSTSVTVPAASHDEIAADELRNGYVHIHGSESDGADSMNRGIIGNDASADGAALTLYLDAATDIEIDSSSAYEVFENPYAAVSWATGDPFAKAGVPAAYVSATLTYVWIQTRGPVWCNPNSNMIAKEGMGAMWRTDGALNSVANAMGDATVPVGVTTQYAGHRILGSYAGNGPLFMLQG